jgi:GTP-binding protein
MEQFFAEPDLVSLGVMIVDARHKPTGDDVTMADWFKSSGRPLTVVANKCDKLKKSEAERALPASGTRWFFGRDAADSLFGEKGTGREALLGEIMKICHNLRGAADMFASALFFCPFWYNSINWR